MTMLRGTFVLLLFTIAAGYAAFSSGSAAPEFLKLLYAFFALTTIVCAMVALAGKRSHLNAAPVIQESSAVYQHRLTS